ncbi:MAG: ABC transporter substrate-binding protein [Gammaproteobacteria bacterium]|nr:ABC transporter substrate-binding protein [Gammaproteobacteria bacterium]
MSHRRLEWLKAATSYLDTWAFAPSRHDRGSLVSYGLALLLLIVPLNQGLAAPSKVVSINLCSDQLLLMLAARHQIASVSRLALEPHSSFMAAAAVGIPVNDAKIEQLLTYNPDLILASPFSPPHLLNLLTKLGFRVEKLPHRSNLEGIRDNIRLMAKWLDRKDQGETLIREMDRRLAEVESRLGHLIRTQSEKPVALFYQPRGYTSGSGTLQHEALILAGWRNLSAELGIVGYSGIDLEHLLHGRPDQLFTSAYTPGSESLAQRSLRHPALARITGGKPIVQIDYRYWICGGPMIIDAVESLANAHNPGGS